MIEHSIVTCPKCGHQATEQMPTDACQFFYDCKGCGERLKPWPGDCCVFCSYGWCVVRPCSKDNPAARIPSRSITMVSGDLIISSRPRYLAQTAQNFERGEADGTVDSLRILKAIVAVTEWQSRDREQK